MRFDIRYRCRFAYDQLVRESQNELRACPASDDQQQLVSYRVTTAPSSRVLSFADYWGTRVDAFGVREPHLVLDVVAEATVETRGRPLLTTSPRIEALAENVFLERHIEYLERGRHTAWGPAIAAEAKRQAELAGAGVVSRVLAIHRHVGASVTYAPGTTYVGVEVDEVFAAKRGVCQDFAHLAVAMCRSVGIPARYVSGYLFTVDDSTGADRARPGADGGGDIVNVQTHAWFEAAVPGFGWLALDPTNGAEVGLRHVKIGHGRDYQDVPPLRGVFAGVGKPELDVAVEIRRHGSTVTLAPQGGRDAARLREVAARQRAEALAHAAGDGGQQHQIGSDPQQQQAAQQQQDQTRSSSIGGLDRRQSG